MDVCCWNLNVCNTEIKPYYNQQVLQDWEGNLVKKPRGEHKVNVYESGVIGMIELIEMKWKGRLEWLDDLDALNQLKWPSRFADAFGVALHLGDYYPTYTGVSCDSGSMVCVHQVVMELRVVQDINPTSVQDNAFCTCPLIGAEFPCI